MPPLPSELIPHRSPFLFLSEITDLVPGVSARGVWRLSVDEPFFAGHFPGRPTLPGVLMVESLAQLGAAAVLADPTFAGRLPLFGGIDRARFRRQVLPGESLELEVNLGRLSAAAPAEGRASPGSTVSSRARQTCSLYSPTPDMRIATWNVNSLRARRDRVEEWIGAHQPDVLCLQETKLDDAAFPSGSFAELGYESIHHGDGRWNGVAILSQIGLSDPSSGLAGTDSNGECRAVSALCGGVRVYSVYVPNGRTVDSAHFAFKLDWLAWLRKELDARCRPDESVAVLGDFNVAPEDRDVWDITAFEGMTHVTPEERAALAHVMDFGLVDSLRALHPDEDQLFSWWDSRGGSFHRGRGMRIDLALVSAPVAARLLDAAVDREARRGQGTDRQPSDHAPVVIDLADEQAT